MKNQMQSFNSEHVEEAKVAVSLIFTEAHGYVGASRIAAWAAQGLAPVCSDWTIARSAGRLHALNSACDALLATTAPSRMRWAWSAIAMATGWGQGLGLGKRLQAHSVFEELSMEDAQARAGVAREACRQSLFALLACDEDELLPRATALASWLSTIFEETGGFSSLVAAEAMLGLREAFEESSSTQGATSADLERARRIGATLLDSQADNLRAEAGRLYRASLPYEQADFAEEFLP